MFYFMGYHSVQTNKISTGSYPRTVTDICDALLWHKWLGIWPVTILIYNVSDEIQK